MANNHEPDWEMFRARFKALRGDLSQTAFARKIGLSRTSVSTYEHGYKRPAAKTINKICGICGVSREWLLGNS